jgi:hypothetical protein
VGSKIILLDEHRDVGNVPLKLRDVKRFEVVWPEEALPETAQEDSQWWVPATIWAIFFGVLVVRFFYL